MKATVYLPADLENAVKDYLADHPEQNFSSLVQSALENKIRPKRNKLLELAGFVSFDRRDRRSPEEIAEDERERPEDEPTKRGFDYP